MLPINVIIEQVVNLGLIEGEGGDAIIENFDAFASHVVGGSFTTPNFLTDHDQDEIDDGDNTADERFDIDAATGHWTAADERVAFTCVLPKETEDIQPLTMWPFLDMGMVRLALRPLPLNGRFHGLEWPPVPWTSPDTDPPSTPMIHSRQRFAERPRTGTIPDPSLGRPIPRPQ